MRSTLADWGELCWARSAPIPVLVAHDEVRLALFSAVLRAGQAAPRQLPSSRIDTVGGRHRRPPNLRSFTAGRAQLDAAVLVFDCVAPKRRWPGADRIGPIDQAQ